MHSVTQEQEEQCDRDAIVKWLEPAGVTNSDDFIARWLGSDSADVMKNLFRNLVMLSDTFGDDPESHEDTSHTIGQVMESKEYWGGVCDQIFQRGRGGFCAFKKKHLLATHSFSMHVFAEAHENGWRRGVPITQALMTERDGKTRNGFTYEMSKLFNDISHRDVSLCMYRFKNGIDRSNDIEYWSDANSIPHANLNPHQLGGWWEPKLFSNIAEFLSGTRSSISDSAVWDGSREQCVAFPLEGEFDKSLVLPTVVTKSSRQLRAGVLWRALSWRYR